MSDIRGQKYVVTTQAITAGTSKKDGSFVTDAPLGGRIGARRLGDLFYEARRFALLRLDPNALFSNGLIKSVRHPTPLDVGANVTIQGHTSGTTKASIRGIDARIAMLDLGSERGLLLLSGSMKAGDAGAPVIDEEGALLGLVVGLLPGQGLTVALPVADVLGEMGLRLASE